MLTRDGMRVTVRQNERPCSVRRTRQKRQSARPSVKRIRLQVRNATERVRVARRRLVAVRGQQNRYATPRRLITGAGGRVAQRSRQTERHGNADDGSSRTPIIALCSRAT